MHHEAGLGDGPGDGRGGADRRPVRIASGYYDEELDRAGEEDGELTRVFAIWITQVVLLLERSRAPSLSGRWSC